jgi:hypothetical protein
MVPLWQLLQPLVMPAWENVAGIHAVVVWQLSQAAVVGTWLAGLPVDFTPSWQVAQLPGATPA